MGEGAPLCFDATKPELWVQPGPAPVMGQVGSSSGHGRTHEVSKASVVMAQASGGGMERLTGAVGLQPDVCGVGGERLVLRWGRLGRRPRRRALTLQQLPGGAGRGGHLRIPRTASSHHSLCPLTLLTPEQHATSRGLLLDWSWSSAHVGMLICSHSQPGLVCPTPHSSQGCCAHLLLNLTTPRCPTPEGLASDAHCNTDTIWS